MMTKQDKSFYTVEQVADMLQLHWQTVLEYIRNGTLTAMRLGKGYRIPVEGFDEFVRERMARARLSALAASKTFAPKPKGGKHSRYRSTLVVPPTSKRILIPSNKENDDILIDLTRDNIRVLDDLKPTIDGLVAEGEVGWNKREVYFRITEGGVVFLRESAGEPENEIHVSHLLSINFHVLKLVHDIYERFGLVDSPTLIKFRMEGIKNNILKMGTPRRSLSIEDRALDDRIEIDEGPVELQTSTVANLAVKIVLQTLRGFGNNRITSDVLSGFLKNMIEGKE